ncbi:MAG: hypothetical protein U1F57_02725 [bacterium]
MATKINDSYMTSAQAAAKTNVDPKIVDQAMKNLGVDIIAKLGEAYNSYLRTVSESLTTLTSRHWEKDVKSLEGQVISTGDAKDHFAKLDTSKLQVYEYRLPEGFLTVDKLDSATRSGLLTKQQADAIKFFFGLSPQFHKERGQEMTTTAYNPTGQERGQQEQGGGNSGGEQDENQEFQEWANQIEGVQGGGGSSGAVPYSADGSYGPGNGGGRSSIMGPGSSSGNIGGRQSISGPGGQVPGGPTGGSNPSGGAFPAPPPPPPPPGGGMGSDGTNYQNKIGVQMQTENNYLNSNFSPDDPYYGWFQSLFGSENWYRNFAGNALSDLQKIKSQKEKMLAELANINPNTAEGQMKIQVLQQKIGENQQSERQIYDSISTAQKANNERKELIKSILDMFFQTNSAIIRNIGK